MIEVGGIELALLIAAALVGATGTWSPCGFSMIETIGPTGHTGGRLVTVAACVTFLPGALVGGAITFGCLALAGSVLPGGWLPYAVAAAFAALAALLEARGARIAPQIRRQLPESWRRVMWMPVASALYGVLLGLGFTTFVLTFGVWALAGIALALGDPVLGLALGLCFGVGRALPIVALAPIADRPAGRAAVDLMATRPELYRGLRLGDAAALGIAAALLVGAAAAEAGVERIEPGADPSADRGDVAVQRGTDRSGELHLAAGGPAVGLPGADPAIGGPWIAVLDSGDVVLLDRETLAEADRVTVPGADALAVGPRWLAVRNRIKGRDGLAVYPLTSEGAIGDPQPLAAAGPPAQLGRPSLWARTLVYARASGSLDKVVLMRLASGERKVLLRSRRNALANPALHKRSVVYVRSSKRRDQLRLRRLGRNRDRLLRRSRKRLWSTALDRRNAYVTVLKGRQPRAKVVAVPRRK